MMKSNSHHRVLIVLVLSVIMLSTTAVWGTDEYSIVPPSQPARVCGKVKVNGVQLTQKTDSGYKIVITDKQGNVFSDTTGNKSRDANGLNRQGFYMINVPIADMGGSAHGAAAGEEAVIHVYKDGKKISVVKPSKGRILVGHEGSVQRVDIVGRTK